MITHEKHLAQFLFTLNTINSSYHQFFINIVNYGTELCPSLPCSQNIRHWWEWGRIQRGNLVKIYVRLATVALNEQVKDQQDSRQKSSCGQLWEGKQRSDYFSM